MKVSPVDRFIPQRKFTTSEMVNCNFCNLEVECVSDIPFGQQCFEDLTPTFVNTAKYANNIINYRKLLCSAMDIKDSKILKCSVSANRKENDKKCQKKKSWPVISRKRPMIKSPDTILDMPDIDTTIYRNVIDWGKRGQIATIFNGEVHLWVSPGSQLPCTQTEKSVLECVRWNRIGTKFAVSRSLARLSIIDGETFKIEKTIMCKCLDCTITAIEWTKSDTVVAGCSYGSVICASKNHPQTVHFYRLLSNEIIDLKFSCNDTYLLVSTIKGPIVIFKWPISWNSLAPAMVFSASNGRCYIESTSWHPWKESVLAVGEVDNAITIWNVNNQKIIDYNVVKPYFKESSFLDCLSFNPLSAELLVSFMSSNEDLDPNSDDGYNFLTVFSDLHTKVDEIQFHIGRVPRILWDGTGTKAATVGADENLVVWNFFGNDTDTEKKFLSKKKKPPTADMFEIAKRFNTCIR